MAGYQSDLFPLSPDGNPQKMIFFQGTVSQNKRNLSAKFNKIGVPFVAQQKSSWYPQEYGFSPWPCSMEQESSIALSCRVGHRQGLGPKLLWLWLWRRLAAVAPIRPLAWGLQYVEGAALKSKKKKKKEKKGKSPAETYVKLANLKSFQSTLASTCA